MKSTQSLHDNWSIAEVIKKASEYNSVLDIGCGTGRLLRCISAEKRIGIDACQAVIDRAKEASSSADFRCLDLSNLSKVFKEQVECVTGIDIIEHFPKRKGIFLLKKLEKIATKCLIFFIPVGKHPQTKDDRGFGNDHYQTHRSTWHPKDMIKLGYEVAFYPNWHKKFNNEKEKGAMFCIKELE